MRYHLNKVIRNKNLSGLLFQLDILKIKCKAQKSEINV